MAENGYKEVVLTGIELSSFSGDLPSLVKKVGKIDGIERIRLGSLDPYYITKDRIDRLCETPELMPLSISLAHKLAKKLTDVRKQGLLPYLRPDGKTQVTVEYDDDKIVRIDTIVVSTQHDPDVTQEQIKKDIIKHVIGAVVPAELLDSETKYFVNPSGKFVIGGPNGDSGLTGRKIIVDTYGGAARHGGGAFSGKDPTKVDRSACYAARYVAKNIVAAGLADRCEIQLAYAIGMANIEKLDLRRPIYRQTAAYGHFGRTDIDLPWEKLDKIDEIKALVK